MKNLRVYLRIIMGVLFLSVGNMQAWGNQNTYYGRGTANVSSASPTGAGTVYVSTTNNGNGTYANTSNATGNANGQGSATVTVYAFARANENYEFVGWNTQNGTTATTSTNNPQNISGVANSTNENNPTNIGTLYAIFAAKPVFYFSATAVATPAGGGTASVSPATTNVRGEHWNSTSATTTATFTATPNSGYGFLGWSTTADGAVVSTANPYSATLTSTSTNSGSPTNTILYAHFASLADPTGISATDIQVSMGTTITANNYTLTTTGGNVPYRHVTATSDNTSIATVAPSGDGFTITGVAIGSATITVTAYNQDNITPACSTTFTVNVIEPETGIIGGTVFLNDYEDHNWSYYSDPDCPIRSLSPADVKITYYGDGIVMTGNADYTATSTDFVQPGDANYVGGAKVNVSTGENQNTFIYYKTLERTDGSTSANPTGRCAYTTIPNPFQVRPTYGTPPNSNRAAWTGWRGFQCWRLKSVTGGSVYSGASGGTSLALNAIINAETEIYFAPNSEYGMEVELEAVWAIAYLVYANDNGSWSVPNHADLGYERNFVVLSSNKDFYFRVGNGNNTAYISDINRPSTITPYLPNGTSGNGQIGRVRGEYANNNDNSDITLQADTKFENVQFTNLTGNNNIITAAGYNLIVGRGCTSTNVGMVRGMSDGSTSAVNYTIRLESGTFGTFALIDDTARTFSSTISTRAVFGSDYDRAKSDNSKLSIAASSTIYGGNAAHTFSGSANRNNITYDWLIKSGRVQGSTSVGDAAADKSIYIGNSISGNNANSIQYCGKRRLTMEGGEIASIAGSVNCYGNNYANYGVNDGTWSVMIRLKGGTVRGSIYGAAAYAGASGDRLFLFTGGTVNGWVAGGANGTQSDGGMMYGSSSIYIGGNTSVNSNSSTSVINRAVGGNVFGAGCGYGASSNSGQVTEGTTVVVADEAYVERGVYGGGSYGYTTSTSTLYVSGGHVEGKNGGVSGTSYSASITGGVFGGACQNQGGTVNITMTDGLVEGGVYGGSNATGTISGNVTMQIDGGQVGADASHTANIHGGGYGANTAVNGNVSVTLGASTSATDSVTVFGNVYGGSALGDVNDNANDNTTVTMNKALINGNLFGGALGDGAAVTGRITVNVNGGRVNGNVFGGGDAAAYSHGGDFPVVNMTGGQVTNLFGGGKGSTATVTGNPKVTLSGTAHVTGNVYGGGDAAQVSGETNVILRD